MKETVLILIVLGGSTVSVSPNRPAQASNRAVLELRREVTRIKSNSEALRRTVESQARELDELKNEIRKVRTSADSEIATLKAGVRQASEVDRETQEQVQRFTETLSRQSLYWIIAALSAGILGLVTFLFLRRRVKATAMSVEQLQVEANKYDSELSNVLLAQLKLLKEQSNETAPAEVDHKLALRVGDEIHRMRKRIANMPSEVKGIGALSNSLNRLEEEFNGSGYEIYDLLGTDYDDGLNVEGRFVDDPNVPPGKEIITDVLRPQIMFQGRLIQSAKVEVGRAQ